MIQITKAAIGPRILSNASNRGQKKTAEMKKNYDAGQRDFNFISSIYGAKSVKNALIKAQHDKCCFCESKISHISYGDVEHFRPKGGWIQDAGDNLTQPGYYWLAYDWANLFLSCQICNQRHKKNLFPLQDPLKRAQSHHADIDNEDPLFINPTDDNPEDHIGFRDEVPFAINGSERGERTITSLGLDRAELNERRSDYLTTVLLLAQSFQQYQQRDAGDGPMLKEEERTLMEELHQHLELLQKYDKPYASMIRYALRNMLT